MKFKIYSLVALSATVLLANCSKDGVDGKTSLTRTTQVAAGVNCTYGGTKIETGIDANNNGTLEDSEVATTQTQYVCDGAGATYSSWIDVNLTDNSSSTINGEYYFEYKQSLPATAITADVVNKAVVLMYYKTKDGYVVPVDKDDVSPITDADLNNTRYVSFSAGYIFKQGYLAFLVHEETTSAATYITTNGSAVRYVIVPGDVAGRNVADLKKLPYSEIAKMYNIQD